MNLANRCAAVFFALASTSASIAQDKFELQSKKVDQAVIKALVTYGRRAESLKVSSLARRAYQIILDHYDVEQPTALRGLGYTKGKDGWSESSKPLTKDTSDERKRKSLERQWSKVTRALGDRHGRLGMELIAAGHISRGNEQLERALSFHPGIRAWHEALGHEELEGFFGTDEQLAFVKRFREMRDIASEVSTKEYATTKLTARAMPFALRKSGLPFVGAKSKHFTHWIVGDPDEAADSLQWAERSFELLKFLAGPHMPRSSNKWIAWHAILRNDEQRDALLANSPDTRGKHTLEQAKLFGGSSFKQGKQWATVSWISTPNLQDPIVAHVVQRHFAGGRNKAFSEGLMHTCTWLLCGTTKSYYARLPHTVTKGYKPMPRAPGDWRKRLFDEIDTDTDWQLEQLPRERLDNFRDSARVKAWSFMTFLVARHPQDWAVLYDKMGKSTGLMPETVAERFEEHLDRSIGELDAEWREWARRGSRIGKVTGW